MRGAEVSQNELHRVPGGIWWHRVTQKTQAFEASVETENADGHHNLYYLVR